ncbi:MAG: queuosine salvage family protein [Trueperaceae bacterium]|nr:queuosine salvage family protein [Trueperaceae bacterium]
MSGLLDDVRDACAAVASRARFVHLQQERLAAYAEALSLDYEPPRYDPDHHYLGEPDATLAYIVTLDAVNFGSGYFPQLQKRPAMSGYFTVASALKDRFETGGPLSPAELRDLDMATCADIFGQDTDDPVRAELMRLFTEALNELGSSLLRNYSGSFVNLILEAEQSAERLAEHLSQLRFFRDVSSYQTADGSFDVPLYKRAQITASDLALAFGGAGYGAFDDLDRLTIFADNLVPHVLRVDGLLRYDPGLLARIERGELIEADSPEEIEIRAVALHAAERLVGLLRDAGHDITAQQLDVTLWNRGQQPRYKDEKRHRTRTIFY